MLNALIDRAARLLATPLFGTKPREQFRPAWRPCHTIHPDLAAKAYIGYSPIQSRYIAAAWQREQAALRQLNRCRGEYERAEQRGDTALAQALSEDCFRADEAWQKDAKALRIVVVSAGRPSLRTPDRILQRMPETLGMQIFRSIVIGIAVVYLGGYLLLVLGTFGLLLAI